MTTAARGGEGERDTEFQIMMRRLMQDRRDSIPSKPRGASVGTRRRDGAAARQWHTAQSESQWRPSAEPQSAQLHPNPPSEVPPDELRAAWAPSQAETRPAGSEAGGGSESELFSPAALRLAAFRDALPGDVGTKLDRILDLLESNPGAIDFGVSSGAHAKNEKGEEQIEEKGGGKPDESREGQEQHSDAATTEAAAESFAIATESAAPAERNLAERSNHPREEIVPEAVGEARVQSAEVGESSPTPANKISCTITPVATTVLRPAALQPEGSPIEGAIDPNGSYFVRNLVITPTTTGWQTLDSPAGTDTMTHRLNSPVVTDASVAILSGQGRPAECAQPAHTQPNVQMTTISPQKQSSAMSGSSVAAGTIMRADDVLQNGVSATSSSYSMRIEISSTPTTQYTFTSDINQQAFPQPQSLIGLDRSAEFKTPSSMTREDFPREAFQSSLTPSPQHIRRQQYLNTIAPHQNDQRLYQHSQLKSMLPARRDPLQTQHGEQRTSSPGKIGNQMTYTENRGGLRDGDEKISSGPSDTLDRESTQINAFMQPESAQRLADWRRAHVTEIKRDVSSAPIRAGNSSQYDVDFSRQTSSPPPSSQRIQSGRMDAGEPRGLGGLGAEVPLNSQPRTSFGMQDTTPHVPLLQQSLHARASPPQPKTPRHTSSGQGVDGWGRGIRSQDRSKGLFEADNSRAFPNQSDASSPYGRTPGIRDQSVMQVSANARHKMAQHRSSPPDTETMTPALRAWTPNTVGDIGNRDTDAGAGRGFARMSTKGGRGSRGLPPDREDGPSKIVRSPPKFMFRETPGAPNAAPLTPFGHGGAGEHIQR